MKILNLFAGIGGNRSAWGTDHEITAVEFDPDIAQIYHERFPHDMVIVGDAYEFIEQHIDEFEFIWGSPICKTHSKLNLYGQNLRLPDLRLYSIIIFLERFHRGLYCIENVVPYYDPLVKPTVQLGRHLFWSNFNIPIKSFPQPKGTIKDLAIKDLQEWHNIYKTKNREYLRNCVDYRIGKYILDCAIKPSKTLDIYL